MAEVIEKDITGAVSVDWGDGSTEDWPLGIVSGTHRYAMSGTYTIRANDEGSRGGVVDMVVTNPPNITAHSPNPVVDTGVGQVLTFIGEEFIPGVTEVKVFNTTVGVWESKTPVFTPGEDDAFKVSMSPENLNALSLHVVLTNGVLEAAPYIVTVQTQPTVPLTGVLAGVPGSFEPEDTTEAPNNLLEIATDSVIGDAAWAGNAAWTEGQYVEVGINSDPVSWRGTAWGAGAVPTTATGANSDGTWTPEGAMVPADFAALSGVTANPTGTWVTGASVLLADASRAYWDGTDWTVGIAP